jgi:hypothetical protein
MTSAIARPRTALSKAVGASIGQAITWVASAAIGEFQISVMSTMTAPCATAPGANFSTSR